MRANFNISETGRSRTSSYTSPKAFLHKQPQILHNYKASSNEKLFQRSNPDPQAFIYGGESPFAYNQVDNIEELPTLSEKGGPLSSEDFLTNLNPLQQNLQASKAYINAMKALQTRNKALEDDRQELEKKKNQERDSYEKQLKDFENILKEKSNLFKTLEGNLKEKLFSLEEETTQIVNQNKMLETELVLIREEKTKQQENYNRSFRECLSEKNDLKTSLKIAEDKGQYLRQENESLREELQNIHNIKQKSEEAVVNLQEKNNEMHNAFKIRSLDSENEINKLMEKVKYNEEYYERLIEQELNEKQEIYKELNELKGEFENVSNNLQEIQADLREKEKQSTLLQERIESLIKENNQIKHFAEYTQEMNEKLINNVINDSISNINLSKVKTPQTKKQIITRTPELKDHKKDRLFTLENQENRETTNGYRERKKQYRAEYEATVEAISEMERELKDLIEKYRHMSIKIVNIPLFEFYYKDLKF